MVSTAPTQIEGTTAPGYEAVAEAFDSNFTARGEVGAAFAAYVDCECVVDLWGGWADREAERPWTRDTLQLIFSGTKGLVATTIMHLVDEGHLDVEHPVSQYWPEFASHDKGEISIGDVLSHQAGLPALPANVTLDDLADDVAMAARVAEQRPMWPQERRVSYHAFTYGWIAGELVRRITGTSIGQYFARRIARPLNLEAWIGLPPELEDRVSTITVHESFSSGWQEAMASAEVRSIYGGLPLFDEPLRWNRPEFHAAEIPGGNGIATARAMASLYGTLACGGRTRETALLRPATIEAAIQERSRGADAVSGEQLAFASGFALQGPYVWFGPSASAFGHGGAGGSIHGAWPDLGAGFSYTMNEMREEVSDQRSRVLLASLYAAAANRSKRSLRTQEPSQMAHDPAT